LTAASLDQLIAVGPFSLEQIRRCNAAAPAFGSTPWLLVVPMRDAEAGTAHPKWARLPIELRSLRLATRLNS